MAGQPSGAYENVLLSHTWLVSGNALSAATDQFIFVKMGLTENEICPAWAETDIPLGISQTTGKDGDGVEVALVGISKLRLAGTVARGNLVKPYTTDTGTGVRYTMAGNAYGALALQNGVSGDVISVLLMPGFST
jgi:hypothetical protein